MVTWMSCVLVIKLHGIKIEESLYQYVDSDDEDIDKMETSDFTIGLNQLPVVLLVHPFESEEDVSLPNKSSSTFLGALTSQVVECLPNFKGIYNPDVEERAYRVGDVVSVAVLVLFA